MGGFERTRTARTVEGHHWRPPCEVATPSIAAYLGHASIQTTSDVYGHLMPGNEDEAVALVDACLERANSEKRLAQID